MLLHCPQRFFAQFKVPNLNNETSEGQEVVEEDENQEEDHDMDSDEDGAQIKSPL